MPGRVPRGLSAIGRSRATPVVGAALMAAGIAVSRRLIARSGEAGRRDFGNRWSMVTVNCPPERLASRSDLPEPLARLGDAVEIRVSRAPGDRGTELGARLLEERRGRGGMMALLGGEDPRRAVRRALREAKALIEVGEVIRRGEVTPERPPRPAEKVMELAGRRGGRQ
ncbi:hypothetical protein [Thermomonospora echinospora]|nr:hypothetical protein [Thermomonospora echinospora]